MPDDRRNRVPGGAYVVTVNLRDRRSDLLVVKIAALRDAVRTELARRPFHIDAWVVLPDHMHCQWTLPESDADFSGRMREIKAAGFFWEDDNMSKHFPQARVGHACYRL